MSRAVGAGELFDVDFLSSRASVKSPALAKRMSRRPFFSLITEKRLSRSGKFEMSPRTPTTFSPISFTGRRVRFDAASSEDKGAFGDEAFGGGETQAAGSSGNEGNLISEFHQIELLS
jgi:hypothetical protein